MRYVSQMRIEHAKLELTLSNKPIKLIAAESGFDGLHSFYHAFQRDAGVSQASTGQQMPAKGHNQRTDNIVARIV